MIERNWHQRLQRLLGHSQVALHGHLTSDLQNLQHRINKMNINIALQDVESTLSINCDRHRHSRKIHQTMLMQHLYDNWDQDNDHVNLNTICHEAIENIAKPNTLHRQMTRTSSDLTSNKNVPTTKLTTTSSATTFITSEPSIYTPKHSASTRSTSNSAFPSQNSGHRPQTPLPTS